ncbi:MAG: methyl-accepting chemotaxis protein [Rhodospirillaceae bacterium]|jgi:methyl-accepting chemotaxis protein|nr:methyl-accepting chemotaxis protein [Rhodospirillaceae bacterium]MBT3494206.1 methyl-accepting chemotaxis protein [Rhodospirillaceae bacterium]MBT3781524.1 methyl-accepting chemotaxis protein [Rhodospirillaceae bacterium]MBT3979253.1 methyl-accepting chemotaxis protein [Rhodospirillaceae bacterium]MBT4170102.1 methyl-accepting chemotaxis protein [Rhodospirillaceae bacterium]
MGKIAILNDLSIGKKLALAVLLPVIGLMVISSQLVHDRYQTMADMGRVRMLADFAPTVSALVHELQKERGRSAGFIGSKGKKFVDTLPAQRTDTNGKRAAFETAYKSFAFTAFDAELAAQAETAFSQLQALPGMRGQVDGLKTTVPGMAKYYTSTIAKLLGVVAQMLRNSTDDQVSKSIGGYIAFLQAKERAGQERAMGAGGFGAGKFNSKIYNRFVELISLQKNYFNSFRMYAEPAQWEFYKRTVSGPAVAEVERMRKIAIASPKTGSTEATAGGYWFAEITKKINLMKVAEDRVSADLRALAADLESAALISVISFGLISLALVVVACGLLFMMTRNILDAVGGLTEVMETLAGGDKTVDIPSIGRGDEVGHMAAAVQIFKESMIREDEMMLERRQERAGREERAQKLEQLATDFDTTVGDILHGVTDATNKMDATAQAMSRSADQAVQQTTTVAAASEQASVNVQTVASASEEMSASIGEINRQVMESTKITAEAVERTDKTNTAMAGLNDAAQKIGDVVSLINDIASQTNLLALNATIEAARAGEAGKGFAVVASEVKNLANQTAKATEEIAAQINGMQSETSGALEALTGISQTIETVSGISTAISAAVEEQAAATQEISRNVDQAAQGTQEVSSNIAEVSQAATDTGAAATEVLTASGELAQKAETLAATVERFLADVKAA